MKPSLLRALALLLGALATLSPVLMNASNASPTAASTELATLGGGCFWCVEGCFLIAPGVTKVVSGYAGGASDNPSYQEVCSGMSGHAEVIQVTFDPRTISYGRIVDLFWEAHDPTQLNRQGNDVGTQYRSVVFTHDDEQLKIAEASKAEAQKSFSQPIVTEISPLVKFFPAEDYHQDYFARNGSQPYCQFVAKPKIAKFKKALED